MLSKGSTGGAGAGGGGRKVSELVAYKNVTDMQHNSSLTVQVGLGATRRRLAAWAGGERGDGVCRVGHRRRQRQRFLCATARATQQVAATFPALVAGMRSAVPLLTRPPTRAGCLPGQVDHRAECVLVPIYGLLVPFHILTIKNASNNAVSRGGPQGMRGGAWSKGLVHLGGRPDGCGRKAAGLGLPPALACLVCPHLPGSPGAPTSRTHHHRCCPWSPCPPLLSNPSPPTHPRRPRTASTLTSGSTSTMAAPTSPAPSSHAPSSSRSCPSARLTRGMPPRWGPMARACRTPACL